MEENFYTTYSDLQLTYTALGRKEDAQEMWRRLTDFLPTYLLKFPDDNRARIFYSGALAEVGRKELAIVEAKKAVDLSPDDPLMLYNAACTFSVLGETKLAVESLKSAFKTGYEYADWIKRATLPSIRYATTRTISNS
jgi:tetratricopeptide (TPR) repeat protein